MDKRRLIEQSRLMCNDELLLAVPPVRGDFLNEVLLAVAKQHIVAQSLDYELKKAA